MVRCKEIPIDREDSKSTNNRIHLMCLIMTEEGPGMNVEAASNVRSSAQGAETRQERSASSFEVLNQNNE